MPRRIPDETKQLMQELYEVEGLSVAEIAKRVNVSYSCSYNHTKIKERGFASLHKYKEHLAKEKGFASDHEYQKHLAKEKGFASLNKYQEHLAKEKGFASLNKYQEHLAKEKGFASWNTYNEHLAEKRQQQLLNQQLSGLIKQRLTELGKTQKWLAEQLGITEGPVSRYISGRTTPKKSLQEKLFRALEVPYHTLDDLLE